MEKYTRGTCEDMCSKSEIDLRIRERLVHTFEMKPHSRREPDRLRMVKEFSRSAAGTRQPKHWELRTAITLKRTVHYLLTTVLQDTSEPYSYRYEFIFDRLRAVRQEIVIQNLSPEDTLPILEPTVRFLCYSAYELCDLPIERFDPKICTTHLQECLKKVLRCYDALSETQKTTTTDRERMERLYLSFNLGSTESLREIIERHRGVPRALRPQIHAHLEYHRGNFYAVLQTIATFSPLEAAIASLRVPDIRRKQMVRFSIAYQSQISVPLEWLAGVLLYGTAERTFLADDCEHYNLHPTGDHGGMTVIFKKGQFDTQRCEVAARKVSFVEEKLRDVRSVAELLLQ